MRGHREVTLPKITKVMIISFNGHNFRIFMNQGQQKTEDNGGWKKMISRAKKINLT